MRHAPRALLAGGLGFAVSLLVACGGGAGLLSGHQASSLNSSLDKISSAVDAHRCAVASRATLAFSDAVAGLPQTINPTLRNNLLQGASTIGQLAPKDCRAATPTTSSTSSTSSSSSTSTSTSSTPTTSSTSTSTSSTSTTTTPTTSTSTSATTSTGSGTTPGGTGGVGVGGG